MPGFGVDRELRVGMTKFFQGGHHLFAFAQRHHRIFGAMERPHAEAAQGLATRTAGHVGVNKTAAAADRRNGRKPVTQFQAQTP